MTQFEREPASERSIADLIRELATNLQTLVSKEIQLVKLELREGLQHAGQGLGLLAGAAVLALVGLIMLALAGVYALALLLPSWAAALIVSLGLLTLGGVLALLGLRQMKKIRPVPDQAVATLKEDQEWLKQQLS